LLYWLLYGRTHLSTDDAYVGADLVQITPLTGGTVVAINADNTDLVRAGQPVVRLDPTDATLALERAATQLAQAVRSTRGQTFSADAAAAEVALRAAQLKEAQGNLARRQKLAGTEAVTAEELANTRDAVASAEAALNAARQQQAAARAQVLGSPLAEQPAVASAISAYKSAWLNWRRTVIVAPVDGYVARRTVQVGSQIQPGTPLMAVVPLSKVWVEANYKETQLSQIRIGQPVTLTSDVYGSSVEYSGRVAGLSAGTGSAFSLLPPQNATGNWIKVVQRVPVRIELDPEPLKKHPLRVGLSMVSTVDTTDTSGPVLTTVARAKPVMATRVYAAELDDVSARVADLIAANAGGQG
ncbi:HlyD family efflux transporter periplasmic adaptor subunit, partial [Laribacter hongkongensis]|uniref:HlyD family secretion protein n=1 Tax=Laribacter hongkongensis TaxID=168471 RepID=UPI001EFCCD4F